MSLRIRAALQTGCCPCASPVLSQLLSASRSVITGFWFSASGSSQPVWLCQGSLPLRQCPLRQILALATDRPVDDLPLEHLATYGSVGLPEHEACWEGAGRGPGSSSVEGLRGGMAVPPVQNPVLAHPAPAQASGSDASPQGPAAGLGGSSSSPPTSVSLWTLRPPGVWLGSPSSWSLHSSHTPFPQDQAAFRLTPHPHQFSHPPPALTGEGVISRHSVSLHQHGSTLNLVELPPRRGRVSCPVGELWK